MYLIDKSPKYFLEVSSQLAFWLKGRSSKFIFKMAVFLYFRSEHL